MSSEAGATAYAFRQLDAPAHTHGAQDMLTEALSEAGAIRENARVAGEAEGREAGMAAARAEAQPALDALHAAAADLTSLRERLTAELQADAAALGVRLAEQIVAGAIDVAPERLSDIAGLALRRLTDRRSVVLIVNPTDLELLSGAAGSLQAELGGIENLGVQADRRIARGGIIARTEEGEIDATLDAQLERAREIVAAELSSEGADVGTPDDEGAAR